MSMWLYQLNQVKWPPNTFRYEIWENQRWHWDYGQNRGDRPPAIGDVLVFFYAAASGANPGIYAWAVVERCDVENDLLYFIPTAPTNHLKMDPWWDEEARQLADEIRGAMKQATLFPIPQELGLRVRKGIKEWLFKTDGGAGE